MPPKSRHSFQPQTDDAIKISSSPGEDDLTSVSDPRPQPRAGRSSSDDLRERNAWPVSGRCKSFCDSKKSVSRDRNRKCQRRVGAKTAAFLRYAGAAGSTCELSLARVSLFYMCESEMRIPTAPTISYTTHVRLAEIFERRRKSRHHRQGRTEKLWHTKSIKRAFPILEKSLTLNNAIKYSLVGSYFNNC